jgi:hypothetical protein
VKFLIFSSEMLMSSCGTADQCIPRLPVSISDESCLQIPGMTSWNGNRPVSRLLRRYSTQTHQI